MIVDDTAVISRHFSSRQQCLYRCVCFMLLVLGMYNSDSSNVPNIDWLREVVANGGCARVVQKKNNHHHEVQHHEERLLL